MSGNNGIVSLLFGRSGRFFQRFPQPARVQYENKRADFQFRRNFGERVAFFQHMRSLHTGFFFIQISEHDDYSKNICERCLNDLIGAARFRDRCLKSNYLIQSEHAKNGFDPVEPEVIDLVESDDGTAVSPAMQKYDVPARGLKRKQRRGKIKIRVGVSKSFSFLWVQHSVGVFLDAEPKYEARSGISSSHVRSM